MTLNAPLPFVVLSVLLSLAVVAFLLRVLWRASRPSQTIAPPTKTLDVQAHTSAGIYQEALIELNAELAAGQLSESHWQLARADIAQRLSTELSELPNQDAAPAAATVPPASRSRFIQGTALVLLLLLPFAFGLYHQLGEPDAMDSEVMALAQADSLSPEALERGLSKRVASRPSDAEAWIVLARIQRAQKQYAQAANSFEQAHRLTQDPLLALERVEALALQQGGRVEGDANAVIQAALAPDPNNSRALLLAGQVAFGSGDFSQALAHWGHLLAQLPPDSEGAAAVQQAMSAARQQGGQSPAPSKAPTALAQNAPGRLQGRVRLDPALLQRVSPQDTLFITAVAVNGSPMPLAVLRRPAADLLQAKNHALDFELDDRLAMSPEASLSAFARQSADARVWVRARISKSGNPMVQPGDLRVQSEPLKVGSRGIVLNLSEVVP